jgi:hypothetical protein
MWEEGATKGAASSEQKWAFVDPGCLFVWATREVGRVGATGELRGYAMRRNTGVKNINVGTKGARWLQLGAVPGLCCGSGNVCLQARVTEATDCDPHLPGPSREPPIRLAMNSINSSQKHYGNGFDQNHSKISTGNDHIYYRRASNIPNSSTP